MLIDALKGKPVCIDFDGTCVAHEFPKVGRYIGAQPVLLRMVKAGCKLVLFTMRSGDSLKEAVDWFSDNGIKLHGIQHTPGQYNWTDSPKAYGALYIDDAALGCPLLPGLKGEKPFVDWDKVEELLFGNIEK